LGVSELGQRRVGRAVDMTLIDPDGQGVTDEEQLHGGVLLCSAVEGLFISEHGRGGDGPTVALVHGSLDRSAAFARVQRHLDDLRVLRYDRRGYGRSLHLGPAGSFQTQVDDLAAVLADRPAVVVGHSLGGVIALALAQQRPDLVTAVVAYESPMAWMPWWPGATAGSAAMAADGDARDAAERFMRRMVGDERWEGLPQRTREQRRAEGPALVAELRSIRTADEPPYVAGNMRVPVVAAHGTESAAHHRAAAEALAEQAPLGELVIVDGASHGVHLTHPAELAGLARRAIERAATA
jgi:pimeloyl-ACP methyl ester carboxylesterase